MNVSNLIRGDRIQLDYGCMYGTEEITVLGVDSNRWGFFAECIKADGSRHILHGNETLQGIGWRRIASPLAVVS